MEQQDALKLFSYTTLDNISKRFDLNLLHRLSVFIKASYTDRYKNLHGNLKARRSGYESLPAYD
jgi:hypothetical protein